MNPSSHAAFTAAHPLTVLIVDDHFVVRSGLVASLEADDGIRVVAEIERGEDVIAAFHQHRPMVVLMDLQLPGIDGVAATAALCQAEPDARVLIFSSFSRDDEIQEAFDAGALGYLQKSATLDELVVALKAVAVGVRHLSRERARQLAEIRLGPTITPREREILTLIAGGCANKSIGDRLGISEDTVKRHVTHILQKLEVHDRTQATVEAIRRGILKMPT